MKGNQNQCTNRHNPKNTTQTHHDKICAEKQVRPSVLCLGHKFITLSWLNTTLSQAGSIGHSTATKPQGCTGRGSSTGAARPNATQLHQGCTTHRHSQHGAARPNTHAPYILHYMRTLLRNLVTITCLQKAWPPSILFPHHHWIHTNAQQPRPLPPHTLRPDNP